jgi:hypothetical protein
VRAYPVVAILLAAVVAGGCAKKKPGPPPAPAPLTGAEVAKTIDAQLPKTFNGLKVAAAVCPATLAPTEDKPAFCTLKVEGLDVRIRVDRPEGGKFTVSTDQAVVPLDQLERALTPLVAQKGGQPYVIDCGDEAVKVFDPPSVIPCTATPAHGPARKLAVTIQDKKGTFTFEEAK